jgi:serine/threonine protein kinase
MVPYFENRLKRQSNNTNLEDLVYVNKISDGQFGGIYLVRDNNKNLYSLKSMSKSLLEEYEVQKFINEEKKILNTIAFPFVI